MAEDPEAVAARKRRQSDPCAVGGLNGKGRWRGDRDNDRTTGNGRLLDEFHRHAGRQNDGAIGRIDRIAHERANQLVEGIVAADIFTCAHNAPARQHKARAMHRARPVMERLEGTKRLGGRVEIVIGDPGPLVSFVGANFEASTVPRTIS